MFRCLLVMFVLRKQPLTTAIPHHEKHLNHEKVLPGCIIILVADPLLYLHEQRTI